MQVTLRKYLHNAYPSTKSTAYYHVETSEKGEHNRSQNDWDAGESPKKTLVIVSDALRPSRSGVKSLPRGVRGRARLQIKNTPTTAQNEKEPEKIPP